VPCRGEEGASETVNLLNVPRMTFSSSAWSADVLFGQGLGLDEGGLLYFSFGCLDFLMTLILLPILL
jgi:hypothetical protein